jgi:hypothetical protein
VKKIDVHIWCAWGPQDQGAVRGSKHSLTPPISIFKPWDINHASKSTRGAALGQAYQVQQGQHKTSSLHNRHHKQTQWWMAQGKGAVRKWKTRISLRVKIEFPKMEGMFSKDSNTLKTWGDNTFANNSIVCFTAVAMHKTPDKRWTILDHTQIYPSIRLQAPRGHTKASRRIDAAPFGAHGPFLKRREHLQDTIGFYQISGICAKQLPGETRLMYISPNK